MDTQDQWGFSPNDTDDSTFDVYIRGAPVRLVIPDAHGGHPAHLHLVAALSVRPYKADDGDHRCKTLAYRYTLSDVSGAEVVSWHWHPKGYRWPHLHAKSVGKGHIPTGRITWEGVVRYLLEDWEVRATPNKDWSKILKTSEDRHLQYRTWTDEPPVPP